MNQQVKSWSTDPYNGIHAVRLWQELVADTLIACDISALSTDGFEASLSRYGFGPVTFQEVQSSGSHIRRTREQIRRDRKDCYFIVQQRSGTVCVEQGGRTAVMGPGDCVLLSARSPYSIKAQGDYVGLSMTVPNDVLQLWLPEPELMTSQAIDGTEGWGRALSATLANFSADTPENLALPPSMVVDQVLAQLAIALGADASPTTRHQNALLRRLGETLSDRYREPDFDPSQLAEEHGLSKRYIHLLFARAGTSFGKELARVRLERAKRLLEDHRFNCIDIMEIALRCGFRDSSGFSKRFRGEYGYPPSAYRRKIDHGRQAAHASR